MTSNLKYRAGFGWMGVVLIAAMIVIALVTSGVIRFAAAAATVAIFLFMAYQWRKWNKRGWHQVHFRAMLVYASTTGEEMARAESEGQPFSKVNACRTLARAMVGREREANADAMVDALVREQGSYFADLVEKHGVKASPELDAKALKTITETVRQFEFGPELVIANVVENSFGGEEAARYVMALLTKEAH